MFPLGTVLFPHMPLALRIFEPRYLRLMADLLEAGTPEFGVVLIERGFEVGGGDHRFDLATVARVVEMGEADEMIKIIAVGGRRVAVREWLPDDPYPKADVTEVAELEWSGGDSGVFDATVTTVRRSLAEASEFSDLTWPPDVALHADPVAASWQLAGVTPAGPLDQMSLLRSTSLHTLLEQTALQAQQAVELLRMAAAHSSPEEPPGGTPHDPDGPDDQGGPGGPGGETR